MLQALNYVRARLFCESGIALEDAARWKALDEAMRAGRATAEEHDLARRFSALVEIAGIVAERFPPAASPASFDPQQVALEENLAALTSAMHGCDVGLVTPASLAALRTAIGAFAAEPAADVFEVIPVP